MKIAKLLLPGLAAILIAGCGFQLRGLGTAQLPPSLTTLRVVVQGSQAANDPLRLTMEDALRVQAGATITQAGDAPVLTLTRENIDSQVLTVDASGKVSTYLVRYELSFNVVDAGGEALLLPQTLRLQRDYRFNPLDVLAKEQEEETLKRELRRDALSQVVRRLARLTPPKKDVDQR
jgi:LPS-assembly lipoprotein